jgi:hypothetical protein
MGSVVDPGPLRDELLAQLAAAHEPGLAELRAALAAAVEPSSRKEIGVQLRSAERTYDLARRALLRGFEGTAVF